MSNQEEFINTKKDKKGFFRSTGGYLKGQAFRILNKRQLVENAEYIKELSDVVFNKNKEAQREEEFFQAVRRLGSTPEQVLKNYKMMQLSFSVAGIMFLISFLMFFYFSLNKDMINFLATLGFMAISVSVMIQMSFRASQIKKMKLYPFIDWISNNKYWIPKNINEEKWKAFWKKMLRNRSIKELQAISYNN